jgi:chitin disaccharide deacetylase
MWRDLAAHLSRSAIVIRYRRSMPDARRMLIVNGDDFGFSEECNAGIIQAHCVGILSSASLMTGGSACAQAVNLAKRNSNLAVGLHLSFSDVKPMLPPEQVERVIQCNGFFPPDERAVFRALWSIKGRQQIRAEIAAQFAAFHQLGISCDHVNVHRNAHRHLLLAQLVFQAAAQWNVRAVRIAWDPEKSPSWRWPARLLRTVLLRGLAAFYGLQSPRLSIGRTWTVPQLIQALASNARGSIELYFHPVDAASHAFADDLPALINESVKQAARNWILSGYQAAMAQTSSKVAARSDRSACDAVSYHSP